MSSSGMSTRHNESVTPCIVKSVTMLAIFRFDEPFDEEGAVSNGPRMES